MHGDTTPAGDQDEVAQVDRAFARFACCDMVGRTRVWEVRSGNGGGGEATVVDWLGLLSAPVFASALPFLFRGPAAQSRDKDDSLSAERGRALEDQQQ